MVLFKLIFQIYLKRWNLYKTDTSLRRTLGHSPTVYVLRGSTVLFLVRFTFLLLVMFWSYNSDNVSPWQWYIQFFGFLDAFSWVQYMSPVSTLVKFLFLSEYSIVLLYHEGPYKKSMSSNISLNWHSIYKKIYYKNKTEGNS